MSWTSAPPTGRTTRGTAEPSESHNRLDSGADAAAVHIGVRRHARGRDLDDVLALDQQVAGLDRLALGYVEQACAAEVNRPIRRAKTGQDGPS